MGVRHCEDAAPLVNLMERQMGGLVVSLGLSKAHWRVPSPESALPVDSQWLGWTPGRFQVRGGHFRWLC